MTTDAHANLTGTDLHENKGVAAASDDTVATAASGLTVWQKLTAANLTGTGNPFGGQLFHVQDEKTSGVNGQALGSAVWNIRDLQTVKTNEITSASLATSQITLPTGTYFIDVTAPAAQCGAHRCKLYNVTDLLDTLYGSSAYSAPSNAVHSDSLIKGRFTITGTKVFEIRHNVAFGAGEGGLSTSMGGNEIYTQVLIWKVG